MTSKLYTVPAPLSTAPPLLTTGEAAAHLRLAEKTVRKMAARGDLAAFKLGNRWRIPATDVPGLGVLP